MHEGEPSIGIALQLYYNRFYVYCQPVPGFRWGRFYLAPEKSGLLNFEENSERSKSGLGPFAHF